MSQGPLEGYRVVELAQGIPGALAGMHLGDGGADVIKVETPDGDIARQMPPFLATGESAVFVALNRNKRGVRLDVHAAEGREALRRLIAASDVLIEDVDLTREIGLDVAALIGDNDRLVRCRISGWGPQGPLADQPGAEIVAQMASEATLSLGRLTDPPIRLGTDAASSYAGIYAAQGILAALLRRHVDGQGQTVDVSLFGCMLMMRATLWAAISNPDDWWGFHTDSYVKPPDHGYQAKDGALMLVVGRMSDDQWDGLLADLGLDDLTAEEKQFLKANGSVNARYGHLAKPLWERGLANVTVEEAMAIFNRHGGNAYRINDYPHLFAHPQTQHLGIVTEVMGANGPLKVLRPPFQFSEDPVDVRLPPPALGQHTDDVLAEIGYDAPTMSSEQRATKAG